MERKLPDKLHQINKRIEALSNRLKELRAREIVIHERRMHLSRIKKSFEKQPLY